MSDANAGPTAQEIDLARVQSELLNCLSSIDEFCRSRRIDYWIDSGTLLGAVRHGGFIPWDDDVDLCMSRADAARFAQETGGSLGPRFTVVANADDPSIGVDVKIYVNGSHVKVKDPERLALPPSLHDGIYVDILVADPLAARPVVRRVERAIAWLVRTHSWSGPMSRSPVVPWVRRMRWRLASWVPARVVAWLTAALDRRMRGREFDLVGIGPAALFNGHAYDRDVVFPLTKRQFGGLALPAPADADAYLTGLYGPEYMSLPPVEARVVHAKQIWFDS
jgi:lipopolysaccharide cholinephosphotransferase